MLSLLKMREIDITAGGKQMNRYFKHKIMVLTGAALALAGCAITPENAYPEAMTARECQVLHEADVRNTRTAQSVNTSSSGNALIDAFARGLGAGVAESATQNRLAACLQRVGAPAGTPEVSGGLAPLNSAPTATQSVQPSSGSLCAPGNGIFVRGDGYCIGNL